MATQKRIANGILASLVGGIIFSVVLEVSGSMQMIAALIHSESDLIGWLVHMVLSACFGVTWVLIAGQKGGVMRGLIYGAILWVAGPLIVMPALMGKPLFAMTSKTLAGLVGHLIYGLITGLVYAWLMNRDKVDVRA